MENIIDYNNHTIEIIQDTDPENPRSWDDQSTMIICHSRYNLGDKQVKDMEQEVIDLFASYATGEECREVLLESIQKHIPIKHRIYWYRRIVEATTWQDAIYDIFASSGLTLPFPSGARPKSLKVLPLYLYDHSGLAISTVPFSCPWDSGYIGFIYSDKPGIDYKYLRSVVEEYNEYLQGGVWGFVIRDSNGVEIDSCWGLYGYEYAVSEAKKVIDYMETQHAKQA